MFRRAAFSRSTVTLTCRPFCCWSLATSASSGAVRNRASSRGAHSASSERSASCRVYWYWVRLMRLSICTSWAACMNNEMPCTGAVAARRRVMISAAGLEEDVEPSGVDRGVDRARADERGHTLHIRVAARQLGYGALSFHHGLE